MAALSLSAVRNAAADVSTVLAFPRCATAERLAQPREPSDAERIDLDRLRWLALRAQLAPKHDLAEACYVLAGEPAASLDRYANAFFRGLCDNASGEMTLYRPGARLMSDDEIWLLRLVKAWRSGEERTAGALVGWRVRASARRWMRFLSSNMVRALDETAV